MYCLDLAHGEEREGERERGREAIYMFYHIVMPQASNKLPVLSPNCPVDEEYKVVLSTYAHDEFRKISRKGLMSLLLLVIFLSLCGSHTLLALLDTYYGSVATMFVFWLNTILS